MLILLASRWRTSNSMGLPRLRDPRLSANLRRRLVVLGIRTHQSLPAQYDGQLARSR